MLNDVRCAYQAEKGMDDGSLEDLMSPSLMRMCKLTLMNIEDFALQATMQTHNFFHDHSSSSEDIPEFGSI